MYKTALARGFSRVHSSLDDLDGLLCKPWIDDLLVRKLLLEDAALDHKVKHLPHALRRQQRIRCPDIQVFVFCYQPRSTPKPRSESQARSAWRSPPANACGSRSS